MNQPRIEQDSVHEEASNAAELDCWVEVQGATVHYLSAGDNPRHLLLLHGSGADSARLSYEKLIPTISKNFTVLAPDFPGYGRSHETPNAYTTEGLIEFVGAFLDALGLKAVDVAGLSMGGGVALGLAILRPERIRHAVLMGSHGMTRRSWAGYVSAALTRMPASIYGWSWRYASSDPRRTRRTMQRVWGNHTLLTDDLLEDIRRELARPGAWRVVRTWARSEARWRGLRTYYYELLPQIQTPLLLIHGAKDKLVPISGVKNAAEVIPNARLVVLPECGHWIPRECPDELTEAMHSFLLPSPAKGSER